MDDQTDANDVRPHTPREMGSDAQELIRDWEFLFWAFLMFGLARLAWLYLYRPENNCLSFGPLVRVRVLRRSGVSDALGVEPKDEKALRGRDLWKTRRFAARKTRH